MFGADSALMCTQEPAFEKGDDPMDSRQQTGSGSLVFLVAQRSNVMRVSNSFSSILWVSLGLGKAETGELNL